MGLTLLASSFDEGSGRGSEISGRLFFVGRLLTSSKAALSSMAAHLIAASLYFSEPRWVSEPSSLNLMTAQVTATSARHVYLTFVLNFSFRGRFAMLIRLQANCAAAMGKTGFPKLSHKEA